MDGGLRRARRYHPSVLLPALSRMTLPARFDQRRCGSARLRRSAARPGRPAGRLPRRRPRPARAALRFVDLLRGYEDANDAARLAVDPVHELLLGRAPLAGAALAS